jgi:hypothetical protein
MIQYQVAKLEVIEDLFRNSTNIQATLETQVAYNMVNTLRKKLLEDAEVCLDLLIENQSNDQIKISIYSLRSTIVSANNLLLKMSSGVNTPDAVWVKILFTNIVTELMKFNSELETSLLSFLQSIKNDNIFEETLNIFTIETQSTISINNDSISSESDNLLKKLVSRCLGDYEQAQRLIEYEIKKNHGINRDEAISRALIRWERDNL